MIHSIDDENDGGTVEREDVQKENAYDNTRTEGQEGRQTSLEKLFIS